MVSLKFVSACHRLGVVIQGSLCPPSAPRPHSVARLGHSVTDPPGQGHRVPQKGLRSLGAAGGTQGSGYCLPGCGVRGAPSHPAPASSWHRG